MFDVKYLNAVNPCRTYDSNFMFCNSQVFILLKELGRLSTCKFPLGLQGPSSAFSLRRTLSMICAHRRQFEILSGKEMRSCNFDEGQFGKLWSKPLHFMASHGFPFSEDFYFFQYLCHFIHIFPAIFFLHICFFSPDFSTPVRLVLMCFGPFHCTSFHSGPFGCSF